MRRLGAIPAVFGATPGLDAEKRAQLDRAVLVIPSMHLSRSVEEREERQVIERLDLLSLKSFLSGGRSNVGGR
jgi:hypothetical protein